MKKVALYARVSTEQQIDNYSIPLQTERMRAYCKSRGWDDVDEFIDPGYSGSNLDRPALGRLLKNLDSYHTIVVYKLDRLSRSQKDTLYLIEDQFLKNDVEFVSLSETLDTSSPFGRAMIGILSVFAQLERETITERLRSGRIRMLKENGFWAGGDDRHPTGYIRLKRGQLVVDKEEGPLVTRLFKDYLKLQSISRVRNNFKKEGLPVWKFNRISRILKNSLYIGKLTFSGEEYEGSHEPLIDEETFYKVQRLMDKNKGRNFGRVKDTFLTGKIICGCCGNVYQSYSRSDVLKDGTKKVYRYYICKKRRTPNYFNGEKCLNKTWSKSKLEKIIFDAIESLEVSDVKKKQKPKVNYDKMIEQVDARINKLLDLYVDGVVPKSDLDIKLNELKQDRENIRNKKSEQPSVDKEALDIIKGSINMSTLSNDDKKTVINLLIDKILVNKDEILIEWAF